MSLSRFCSFSRHLYLRSTSLSLFHTQSQFFCTPTTESSEDKTTDNDINKPQKEQQNDLSLSEDHGWSAIIAERPEKDRKRRMRIFSPAKNANTQGLSNTGMWKVEPEEIMSSWTNQLMSWHSTRDTFSSSQQNWTYFQTKEEAMRWCQNQGFEYTVVEPNVHKPKPKSYAKTFGRNGIPTERPSADP